MQALSVSGFVCGFPIKLSCVASFALVPNLYSKFTCVLLWFLNAHNKSPFVSQSSICFLCVFRTGTRLATHPSWIVRSLPINEVFCGCFAKYPFYGPLLKGAYVAAVTAITQIQSESYRSVSMLLVKNIGYRHVSSQSIMGG